MEVAMERFQNRLNGRFNESALPSINASKSLESQFPQPSLPPREVIRCQSCSLVQFRTLSDLCRRCHRPFAPKLAPDLDEVTAPEISDNPGGPPSGRWMEASAEAPGSFLSQPRPDPQIGSAVKRLRRVRAVSQGELGPTVGLRRTYLSRVENDHVMPGPRIVSQIARALGVSICDLFLPQPQRETNGAVLREPACVHLVAMFSELQPRQMSEIVSAARQMRVSGFTPRNSAPLSRSAGRSRDVGGQRRLRPSPAFLSIP